MIQPLQNQQGTKGLQGFASCLENDLLFLINVEWLLKITFVDLLKIWSLHIINRSHPNTFLSIVSISGIWKWTSGYIYQVVSGEFPFAATLSEKNRPEKFPFLAIISIFFHKLFNDRKHQSYPLLSAEKGNPVWRRKKIGNMNTF